ncbi:MAG: hypothetical protein Q8P18_00330 [Pseudomonadota bacterium]|nr:hypothetical protein [Pseudomonadota bacterium]
MGLLSRLRVRLSPGSRRGAPAGIGSGFTPAMAEVWKELEEQVDGELKKSGSSIVGAWEVGAAELGRALIAFDDDRVLIERYSDSLVPALQPFQDLHKGIGTAMQAGMRAGLAAGSLAAATAPLARLMEGLDDKAAEGWAKTAAHLEPIILRSRRPDEARAQFLAGSRALRQACADADLVWRARLEALPQAPNLWDGLTGAAEAWQLSITRALEMEIVRHVKALVAAVREGGA